VVLAKWAAEGIIRLSRQDGGLPLRRRRAKDAVMRVCLFEDRAAADFEPLTLTRPVFDLLCGQSSLGYKQTRYFGPAEVGVVVRPQLVDAVRAETAHAVNAGTWLASGPTVLVNGRWLPPNVGEVDRARPCIGLVGDEPAYAVVGPDLLASCPPEAVADRLEEWKRMLPCRPAGGRLFRWLWEIVAQNGEQIIADEAWAPESREASPSPAIVAVIGPRERLHVDPTARLDPFVLADTTGGPVVVGRSAVVTAFTRLEGPCVVGPRSQVHGAKLRAGTTLGPDCRVGGEIECSVIQGFSNKYHDGFLGHAYLGAWVNLGAGTQTSDLRNDYGEVSVHVNGRLVRTGSNKVGCFLGDHTKTAIGTLLNTGTSAGAFCNLLPGGLLPRRIPSFTRCEAAKTVENGDLDAVTRTAAAAMGRRGRAMTDAQAALLRAVFAMTAEDRRNLLGEREAAPLRPAA
jgi:UDP-N-acetylglucosamine diphosphorylase/glucosamine-1-phosphate N-acetyltransferase